MSQFDIVPSFGPLDAKSSSGLPKLILDAGDKTWWRYTEFFAAHIRNANTRAAYIRAVRHFDDWCSVHRITLSELHPVIVGAYIEDLGKRMARPSVKQHLAALRV